MVFRWDDFELDEEAGELRRAGLRVEIQPKPFALLRLLLAAHPRMVPIDALMQALWPATVVTPASLNRAVTSARRAIGDTGRGTRIASVARRGYRFAGEIGSGEGVALPSAPSPTAHPLTTPFVGRESALAVLEGALRAALEGRGGLVLVSGPPGIGKTRLLRAFADRCAALGVECPIGHCRNREGAPVYWLWSQVLRTLGAGRDTPQLRALRERSEAMARNPTARHDRQGDTESPDQQRFLFFEAVTELLREWTNEEPRVILLEDIQWAGAESLDLLEHVACELDRMRLLVVASLRDGAAAPSGRSVERTRIALRRLDHCHPIELGRFTRGEIEELAQRFLGEAVPAETIDSIAARSEGVPLFVRELLRELRERGESGTSSTSIGPSRTPAGGSGTLTLVRRAIEGLPPGCVAWLEAAAVLGRDFALSVAAEVAGVSREEAARAFDRAVQSGVAEAGDGPAAGRFSHALYREALYDGIAPGRRALLHRRAALALEKRAIPDPLAAANELAHHHFESIAVGDPESVIRFAGHAAGQALARLSFDDAATQLDRASIALDHVSPSCPFEKLETLIRLGECQALARNPERRRATLLEAAALARTLERPGALARAAIAYCDLSEWSPHDPEAIPLLEAAIGGIDAGDPRLSAALETRLAYRYVRIERERAQSLAHQALARARSAGDPHLVQEALYVLLFSLAGPDQLAERAALREEIERSAEATPRRDTALIALLDLACDRLTLGDAVGARSLRARAEELVAPSPHPGLRWHIATFDAGRALLEGRLEEGEALAREALRFGLRARHPYAQGCYDMQVALAAFERGEPRIALDRFGPLIDHPRLSTAAPTHWMIAFVARAALATGDRHRAERLWRRLEAVGFETIPRNIRWTRTMSEVAHLCVELGATEAARRLVQLIEPRAEQHAVLPIPIGYGGPLRFGLGRLQALLGHAREAREALVRALEDAEGIGARSWASRIQEAREVLPGMRPAR